MACGTTSRESRSRTSECSLNHRSHVVPMTTTMAAWMALIRMTRGYQARTRGRAAAGHQCSTARNPAPITTMSAMIMVLCRPDEGHIRLVLFTCRDGVSEIHSQQLRLGGGILLRTR